jgi:bifunctional NMN adenylyltransferase/nudix hydrolase
MSHDRGCPCGKENNEYQDCQKLDCFKKPQHSTKTAVTYDALVFIARAQPFHNGHKAVVDAALEKAKEVIIVVGSSFASRTIRNPFTFDERKSMIKAVFPQENVKVVPVSDYPYDDNKWVAAIQGVVYSAMKYTPDPIKIGLIGHEKDGTSYYLKIFPTWGNESVPNVDGIHATDIRKMLLEHDWAPGKMSALMPASAYTTMADIFVANAEGGGAWDTLSKEYDMIHAYKKPYQKITDETLQQIVEDSFADGQFDQSDLLCLLRSFDKEYRPQYAPTFMTTDAVVVQSGHILLVKRKHAPGMGLWALPGGFLNPGEKMVDGALRELREETKIKVPLPVLRGSIKDQKTFDDPYRSTRGRTITQAFYIDLGFDKNLPKVKGSDDAEKAQWVPFNEVDRTQMFEDHFFIIDNFLNIG